MNAVPEYAIASKGFIARNFLIDGWRVRFDELTEREQAIVLGMIEESNDAKSRAYASGVESNVAKLRDKLAMAALSTIDAGRIIESARQDAGLKLEGAVFVGGDRATVDRCDARAVGAIAFTVYKIADAMLVEREKVKS